MVRRGPAARSTMQHAIFVYYIVSLASGCAGIVLTVLEYLRTRRRVTAYYLGIVLLFTAYLLLLNIHYYQRTVALFDSAVVRRAAETILSLSLALLYSLVPAAAHLFVGRPLPRPARIIFLAFSALPVLETAVSFFAAVPWAGLALPRVLIYLTAGYAVFVLVRYRPGPGPDRPRLARLLPVLILVFIPVQAVDDIQGLLNPAHYPVTALPLYYILGNAVSVVLTFRSLLKPAAPPAGTAARLASFAAAHRITGREVEVIRLILAGCANKEIAGRLGVSFSTVKNHIYSIFKKSGARSKIELFRLIDGGHAPAG